MTAEKIALKMTGNTKKRGKTKHKKPEYKDIRLVRELIRISNLSKQNLYVPKENEWHRFTRPLTVSQK